MRKTRPELKPWKALTPEAQARFLRDTHPTTRPPEFEAPGITFSEDGSGYQDAMLLADIFNVRRGPLYPSPCCGKETEWINSYQRLCPCGKEHRF